MILISKREVREMEKLGYKFGSDEVLHRTYTKHPKYYMTTTSNALKDLQKIRKM